MFVIVGNVYLDGLYVDVGDFVEIGDCDCIVINDYFVIIDVGFY